MTDASDSQQSSVDALTGRLKALKQTALSLEKQTASLAADAFLAVVTRQFAGKIAFASSLGLEDQVITDMLRRGGAAQQQQQQQQQRRLDLGLAELQGRLVQGQDAPATHGRDAHATKNSHATRNGHAAQAAPAPLPLVPIFTIDTGRLNSETLDLIAATNARYEAGGLGGGGTNDVNFREAGGVRYGTIEILRPDANEVQELVQPHGPDLFRLSVEGRKKCCHVRKVNVLRRRLAGLDAWICGLRREQSVTRLDVGRVQWDDANGLIKINPLADWTTQQVWDYIRANDVPYNVLHDRGYPSIGCEPCTREIGPDQDIRAGRWWWESPEQKECGLHVVGGKLVRKAR